MCVFCPTEGADPYCVISCEGQKVTTRVVTNTTNPEWGDSAIFFRKDPVKCPLKVQVSCAHYWHRCFCVVVSPESSGELCTLLAQVFLRSSLAYSVCSGVAV